MSENALVSEAFASGYEIGPIVEKIEVVLKDVPRVHALIALTSIILLIQQPDLSEDQIYEGVKDVSRYVCLWLAGADSADTESPIDPLKMN